MRCPTCAHEVDKVVDSRSVQDGAAIRRRRECLSCGHRFTTYERVGDAFPMIVKRDGRREPYNRDKLMQGLRIACRKRPISTRKISRLVDQVEAGLRAGTSQETSSSLIGDHVMRGLAGLDHVAYIRFASVYESFEDIDSFHELLATMPGERSVDSGSEKS